MERRSCSLEAAKKLEQKLVSFCKKNSCKYTDKEFPASNSSICSRDRSLLRSVANWRRLGEHLQNPSLFVDGVESGDVIQGELGDCWFLGAASVIATRNDLLYPLFVSAHPEFGFFQIKFFKDGEWRVVTIDDYVPVKSSGAYVFAHCKDADEYWVPLLEKAFAKLNGSYEAIASGNFSEGMSDMTGEGCETFNFQSDAEHQRMVRSGEFWELLKYFEEEKFLMGCSKSGGGREKDSGWGILSGHAYAVLRVVEVKAHGKTQKLLQIRNPWGKKEWNGAWSDGSREWTPALMKQLGHVDEDDGTFFMCFEDFVRHYNTFAVCRLLTDDFGKVWEKTIFADRWDRSTAGGCCNSSSWTRNPQYWMHVPRKTKIFIHLAQADSRSKGNPRYSTSIGAYVWRDMDGARRGKTAVESANLVHSPVFINSREYSISFEVTGDFIVLPCTFQPGKTTSYYLTFYSEDPIEVGRVGGGRGKKIAGGPASDAPPTWLNRQTSALVKDKGGVKRYKPPVPSRANKPRNYTSRSAKKSSSPSPRSNNKNASSRHRAAPAPPSRSLQPPSRTAQSRSPRKTSPRKHHNSGGSSSSGSRSPRGGKQVLEKRKAKQSRKGPNGETIITTTTTTKVRYPDGSVRTETSRKEKVKGGKSKGRSGSKPPKGQWSTLPLPGSRSTGAHRSTTTSVHCAKCLKTLKGGERYVTRNGRNYCQKHAYEKCKGCKGDLSSGTVVKFKNKKYHTRCFKCTSCKRQLPTSGFYTNSSGKPVCHRHAK